VRTGEEGQEVIEERVLATAGGEWALGRAEVVASPGNHVADAAARVVHVAAVARDDMHV